MRKSVLNQVGVYSTDKTVQPPEDYELWLRISAKYEIANIPEVLFLYREVSTSMSRTAPKSFLEKIVNMTSKRMLSILDSLNPELVIELCRINNYTFNKISFNYSSYRKIFFQIAELLSLKNSQYAELLKNCAKVQLIDFRKKYLIQKYFRFLKPIFPKLVKFRNKIY
jgi:hypothetical protein